MVSFSELQSANEEMSPSVTHQTLLYMLAMLGQWWRGGDNSPVGTGHPGRGGAGRGGAGRITEVWPLHWAGSAAWYCARLGLSSEQGRHTKRKSADQPETSNKERGLGMKMGAIRTIFRFGK